MTAIRHRGPSLARCTGDTDSNPALMIALRRPIAVCSFIALAACTGSEGTTIDSADGELDVPRRKAPPYQSAPVTAAGSITGTVQGIAVAPAGQAAPAQAAQPVAARCTPRASTAAPVVVFLEDIPRGNPLPGDVTRRYELAVDDCALSPAVSIAAAGGTLNLSNGLNAVHQVAFTFEGMKNPMVRVPFSDPGQVVPSERVLDIPGIVDVQSDLAPAVSARIVVVEHPYAVQTTDGTFTIDSVPPGTYTLVAVGLNGRAESRVEVRAGAATPVTLQLR